MKLMPLLTTISFVFLFVTENAAACEGEAQIIAKVEGLERMFPYTCFALIKPSSVQLYKENVHCPLPLSEVVHGGIEIGLRDENYCAYNHGDIIDGTIFVDVDGTIRLRR